MARKIFQNRLRKDLRSIWRRLLSWRRRPFPIRRNGQTLWYLLYLIRQLQLWTNRFRRPLRKGRYIFSKSPVEQIYMPKFTAFQGVRRTRNLYWFWSANPGVGNWTRDY